MKVLISLVVPVYNMKDFLPRCMDTIIKQQGNYEVILVDDGSTDGSEKLCDWYASKYPNFVYTVHKKNGGLSSARNMGIDIARGNYIIFPDPDDWVEPNFIEKLIELQKKYNPDLLCVGYYIDFDNYTELANEGQCVEEMDEEQAKRALILPPSINGFAWNKLYHMDIIRLHGLRFLDDVGTTEDLDFAYRYLHFCKKIIFSPEDRLYHYYQRDGAATHSRFSRKKVESIRTYEKIIEDTTDKEMICAAREEMCNTAVNLVWSYMESCVEDEVAWIQIQNYLKKLLKYYFVSRRYSVSRKIQAFLAYYTPGLYGRIKTRFGKK